jgi:hypothetical protein
MDVGCDLSMSNVAAATTIRQSPTAQVVNKDHEVSEGLQFPGALLVVIDTVAHRKSGTSGDKQYSRSAGRFGGRQNSEGLRSESEARKDNHRA